MEIKNLVFEGGGMKGIAYAGAIAELEKRGVLEGIGQVALALPRRGPPLRGVRRASGRRR